MGRFNVGKLDFQGISVFLKVMESKNITLTAESLHFSPSTVSKNIARLEQSTGLILFIRNNNRLQPTPAAKVLYDRLCPIMAALKQAVEDAYLEQAAYSRKVNIGISAHMNIAETISSHLMVYQSVHPNFSFQYKTYRLSELEQALRKNEVDLVISFQEVSSNSFSHEYESKFLFRAQNVAVVMQRHPLSKRKTIRLDELTNCSISMIAPDVLPEYMNNMSVLIFQEQEVRTHYCYPSIGDAIANFTADKAAIAPEQIQLPSEFIKIPIADSYSHVMAFWRKDAAQNVKDFIDSL